MKHILPLLSTKDRIHFFLIFSSLFIYSFVEIFSIGLVVSFVQIILDPSIILKYIKFEFVSNYINSRTESKLIFDFSIFLLCVFTVKNLYLLVVTYLYEQKIKNFLTNLSSIYLRNLLSKNFDNILVTNHSKVTNTLLVEFETLRSTIRTYFVLFREALILIILSFSFIMFAKLYFLISFSIMLLVSLLLMTVLKNRLKSSGVNAQIFRANQINIVDNIFRGIKYIKIFNKFEYFLKRYTSTTFKFNTIAGFMGFLQALPKLFIEIVLLAFFLVTSNLLYLNLESEESFLTTLSLLGVIIIRLIPVYTNINSSLITIKYASPIIKSINEGILEIVKMDKKVLFQKNENKIEIAFEKLSVENLSYHYKQDQENYIKTSVLKDINFEIRVGEKIGIIGKTGSGKSTLMNCMMGLLKPTQGSIKFNNSSIFEDGYKWHNAISFVPQDIFLINDNIYKNISLKDEIDFSEKNKIDELISILDLKNLVTESRIMEKLGDKIQKVSEGEKQRIGIARALFKNHKVLFLDEATSSLDVNTEVKILNSVIKYFKNLTIVTIAHRLTTIEKHDKLIMIEDGKIVKIGKPEEVILHFKNRQ